MPTPEEGTDAELTCISDILRRADPAALVPPSVLKAAARALLPVVRLQILGGETSVEELAPLEKTCSLCRSKLSKSCSLATDAVLLDTAAVWKKAHSFALSQQGLRSAWEAAVA